MTYTPYHLVHTFSAFSTSRASRKFSLLALPPSSFDSFLLLSYFEDALLFPRKRRHSALNELPAVAHRDSPPPSSPPAHSDPFLHRTSSILRPWTRFYTHNKPRHFLLPTKYTSSFSQCSTVLTFCLFRSFLSPSISISIHTSALAYSLLQKHC